MARCRSERPALKTLSPGHASACHLNDPLPDPLPS